MRSLPADANKDVPSLTSIKQSTPQSLAPAIGSELEGPVEVGRDSSRSSSPRTNQTPFILKSCSLRQSDTTLFLRRR